MVMGGLVTSTLLTLMVLPTVYDWLESRKQEREEATSDEDAPRLTAAG